MKQYLSTHKRKVYFVLVGVSGLALSYLVLALCVTGLGLNPQLGYVVQTVAVVEYNFVLSHYLTWRDRRSSGTLWKAWSRFHLSRVATVSLNQLLFGLLTWLGLPYLVAHTICVGVTSVINYFVGDRYIFRRSANSNEQPERSNTSLSAMPSVGIVIPVKSSQDTIRDTVLSLQGQSYPGDVQIIMVGSLNDSTWAAVHDLIDGSAVVALEIDVVSPGRDSNAKRSLGLSRVTGEILAVVDSDMVMPQDWLDTVVAHARQGNAAVAGPVAGIGDGFWTRFIDQNPAGAKTPRITGVSRLDRHNIRHKKPPVTANFACTREVYEQVGGPNPAFTNSYEDYEWFSRIVRAGYPITLDARLMGERYHREGFRPLLREYIRSGKGCADHIVTHIRCGFAQSRLLQLLATLSLSMAGLLGVIRFPGVALAVLGLGLLVLALHSYRKVRRPEAIAYPAIAALFAFAFVYGAFSRFVRRGVALPVPPVIREVRLRGVES